MSRLDGEPAVAPDEWRAQAVRAHEAGFTCFDWLTGVDQTDGDPAGFDVVARLLDIRTPRAWNARVLRTRVAEGAPLESLTCVYAGAAWYEREVYEMFGVEFTGFDDGTGHGLRRLLLTESAPQTPLRKSQFLAARAARPWPGAKDPADPEGSRRRRRPPGVASSAHPGPLDQPGNGLPSSAPSTHPGALRQPGGGLPPPAARGSAGQAPDER